MSGKYINTAAGNDTVALLLAKMDELITAFNGSTASALVTTLNTLIDDYASLKASHAALVTKYNTLQGAVAGIVTKLNLETLTQQPYASTAVTGTDTSTAAPAHASATVTPPVATASSQFE